MQYENITNSFITLNADKTNGALYTEINYLCKINNNFDFDMFNINIFLNIPKHTKLKGNSVLLNHEAIELNSDLTLTLKKLRVNDTLTLEYSIIVLSIPPVGKIDNIIKISYDAKEFTEVIAYSNVVNTLIKGVNIVVDKYTDKLSYYLNDTITLFVKIKNTGNIPALNLIYSELIPPNIGVLNLYINNYKIPNNELLNLSLGRIDEGSFIDIKLEGVIKSNTANLGKFISRLSYNYYDDFSEELKLETDIQKILSPNFQFDILDNKNGLPVLSANKELLFIKESSQANFNLSNMGTILIENLEVFVNSTNALAISDLTLNGNLLFSSYNPSKDSIKLSNFAVNETLNLDFIFSLEDLTLRENQVYVYITYDIFNSTKNCYEHKTYTSNKIEIPSYGILFENNSLIKSTNKTIYKKDELIETTIQLKSLGNLETANVKITDSLSPNFKYVKNSFFVNNTQLVEGNLTDGFYLENLSLQDTIIIKYNYTLNCDDSIFYTPPLTIIEFSDPSISYNKEFSIVPAPVKILNPIIIDLDYSRTVEDVLYLDLFNYDLSLKNIGNITLNNVNVSFDIPKNFEIVNVKASCDNYSISLNNTLTIENLSSDTTVKINLKLKASNIDIPDIASIDAIVNYDYSYDNIQSSDRFLTNTKFYNFIKPNLEGIINLDNDLFLTSEDLTGILTLKNIGNIPLNLSDVNIKDHGFYKLSDSFITNLKTIDKVRLAPNDEVSINFSLNLNSANIKTIDSFDLSVAYSYDLNKTLFESVLILKSPKISVLNNSLSLKLSSSKKNYLLDETGIFNLLITNCGTSDMLDSILFLNIPDAFNIENQFVKLDDHRYSLNELKIGLKLGTIIKDSSILLSFSVLFNESSLFNQLISYFTVSGAFMIDSTKQKVSCSFTSNSVNIQVYKLDIQTFITSDKEVLLLNDKINFSTTLINTSSMPIEVKYTLYTSDELEEVCNSKRCDGELIPNEDYIISIPVNDGVTLDNTYKYISYNGSSNILSHGVVQILDNENLFSESKIFQTDSIATILTNNNFKELILEETINCLEFCSNIKEVLNVYVDSKIISFLTTPLYRDLNYFKRELVGYKINFYGELNYSIEYIASSLDEEEDDAIYVENITRFFNSSINLPSNFSNDRSIKLTSSLIDINNLLVNNKIYLTVNLLIDINI